jgi:hypothetical protein
MITQYYDNYKLYYTTVLDAKVLGIASRDKIRYGGVLNSHNTPIEDSICLRQNSFGQIMYAVVPENLFSNNSNIINTYLHGTYIFCGYIFGHYGHFLVESLARTWLCDKFPDYPVIFVGLFPRSKNSELTYQNNEILDILNITKKRIVVPYDDNNRHVYCIEKLLLPTPGIMLDILADPEYLKIMGKYKRSGNKDIDKLWISRKKCSSHKIINETEIEECLKDNGWTICLLEDLKCIKDQLDILSRSKKIAGFEGSAFHNFILMHNSALDNETYIFSRGRNVPTTFDIINKNKNINAGIYNITIKNQIVIDPKQIYDILL